MYLTCKSNKKEKNLLITCHWDTELDYHFWSFDKYKEENDLASCIFPQYPFNLSLCGNINALGSHPISNSNKTRGSKKEKEKDGMG